MFVDEHYFLRAAKARYDELVAKLDKKPQDIADIASLAVIPGVV